MKRFTVLTASFALLALALSGCQAERQESIDWGVTEPSIGYPEPGADMATEQGIAEQSAADQSAAGMSMEPDVITTGYLSLIVDTPSEGADQITEIVTAAGGRIASRSDYTPVDFGQPSSYLDARIPAERLDATLEEIKEVGEVQDISVNTIDVSLQKIDLDARIAVLEASMARLSELLADAETTSDLIAIETALAERQAELDSLTSQRNYLSDQTLFATISVTLSTPEDAKPSDPDGFFDGIIKGWESILAFFAGVIVWSGILVPWLALLVIVVLLIWGIRRLVRKRKAGSTSS